MAIRTMLNYTTEGSSSANPHVAVLISAGNTAMHVQPIWQACVPRYEKSLWLTGHRGMAAVISKPEDEQIQQLRMASNTHRWEWHRG